MEGLARADGCASLEAISVYRQDPLLVAQVSNLLYRGFPTRRRSHVGASADWKSAIQQVGNLRYAKEALEALNCPRMGHAVVGN